MKKGLDAKLIKSLAELGEEKHIDFKGRYFPQEFMMAHWGGYWIPSTIYELMTALPLTLLNPRPGINKFYGKSTRWYPEVELWQASYEQVDETEHRDIFKAQTAPELVDALGKLLVLIIKEGWLG